MATVEAQATAESQATAEAHSEGQQHPIAIYFIVWGLLFVLSSFSYGTDFINNDFLRLTLVLLFMLLKAGFIVAVFMHMAWERLALILAILTPPVVLLVLIGLMAVEGDYTVLTRLNFFSEPPAPAAVAEEH
jgi:cytochrome c oxidase subunit 4